MGVPDASVERSEPRRFGVSASAALVATDAVSAKDVDAASGAAGSTATAGTDAAVSKVWAEEALLRRLRELLPAAVRRAASRP